jgi:hypothetical protein
VKVKEVASRGLAMSAAVAAVGFGMCAFSNESLLSGGHTAALGFWVCVGAVSVFVVILLILLLSLVMDW